jgi:hypothetical protein
MKDFITSGEGVLPTRKKGINLCQIRSEWSISRAAARRRSRIGC